MDKHSHDYNLKEDYLETYLQSKLFLSLRKDYVPKHDPALNEIADLLTQAQENHKPVEEVIGRNLIGFLKRMERAFNESMFLKGLYSTHVTAVIVSIFLGRISASHRTIIDVYLYIVAAELMFYTIYVFLRGYVARRIERSPFQKIQWFTRWNAVFRFLILIALFTLSPSTNLDVPLSVAYFTLGISLVPLVILGLSQLRSERFHKSISHTTSNQHRETRSMKALFIDKLEDTYLKKSRRKTKKQEEPLSDRDVARVLSRNRFIIRILYPLIMVGYIILMVHILNIQVQGGFNAILAGLLVFLMLIFTLLYAVLLRTKQVSLLIHYLQLRDLTVFEKGAIPKKYLSRQSQVSNTTSSALIHHEEATHDPRQDEQQTTR